MEQNSNKTPSITRIRAPTQAQLMKIMQQHRIQEFLKKKQGIQQVKLKQSQLQGQKSAGPSLQEIEERIEKQIQNAEVEETVETDKQTQIDGMAEARTDGVVEARTDGVVEARTDGAVEMRTNEVNGVRTNDIANVRTDEVDMIRINEVAEVRTLVADEVRTLMADEVRALVADEVKTLVEDEVRTNVIDEVRTDVVVDENKVVERIDLGNSLELLMDDYLIENKRGLRHEIHAPKAQEIVFKFDRPWEGNVCAYYTLIDDNDRLRLYYRGADRNPYTEIDNGFRTCYAESFDHGQTWERPNLGLFEYQGNWENNIIWVDKRGVENFTPFKDTRPGIPESERYKAIGSRLNPYNLYAYVSSDGIRWRFLREDPLLTYYHGKFDTQNITFWNPEIEHYMIFFRSYLDKETNLGRGIRVAISQDFIHWKKFKWLQYNDQYPQEKMQLYTNCIQRYYRSPKFLIGFPNRYSEHRQGYPGHPVKGIFDAIFMSSRDGYNWTRYQEAMIRPGSQANRWATRNNMVALGMIETNSEYIKGVPEISVYISEGYYLEQCALRRFTFRLDGFVSLRAPFSGGEFVTKVITFTGNRLMLNYSTSALGEIRVEIQDKKGRPIAPYLLQNCQEVFGDKVKEPVRWRYVGKSIVKQLIGKPIKLRFVMKDCDLYSFQFITVGAKTEVKNI